MRFFIARNEASRAIGFARFSRHSGLRAITRLVRPSVGLAGGILAASAFGQTDYSPAYKITTLAGSGQSGYGSADGTGAAAEFKSPYGVAVNGLGTVYVADTLNSTIRMITPAGVVTTLAGTPGNSSHADGTGSLAAFARPSGVAVDGSGNVYVADYQNDDIRMIAPGGIVSTLAGATGISGSVDADGITAEFDAPQALAVDGSGNIYVADTGNDTIREVTPVTVGGVTTWHVTTIAGSAGSKGSTDGTGSSARFNGPKGVAVDGAGNVYVADSGNSTIREITPPTVGGVTTWTVTTLAGLANQLGQVDATGGAARFYYPCGIALDGAGNIYVADTDNDAIRMIAPGGVVTSLAGGFEAGYVDATGGNARFFDPYGIAADGAGNIFVADTENETIRAGSLPVAPAGPTITTQPVSQTVNVGSDVLLTVSASGDSALSYQWLFNGNPISGATGATLSLGDVQVASAGTYQVDVSDAQADEVSSAGATLTVSPVAVSQITTQPHSQTVNGGSTVVFTVSSGGSVLPSLRTGSGSQAMLSSGTTYQWQFNGTNLSDGGAISGSTGPQLVITGATAADEGDYSCLVTTNGVAAQSDSAALVVGTAATPGYLVNISSRAFVGTGDSILIGGFFVGGSTSRSVLIQALGPALSNQGVTGVLQHPALTIHNSSGVVIYSDTGWGNNPVLLKAAASAYAQPVLQPDSADSEVLLTLPPGGYTAEISGADGGTGVALCAIYQLP